MVDVVEQGQEVFLTPTQYDELKQLDIDQHTEMMEKFDALIEQSTITNSNLTTTNTELVTLDESIRGLDFSIPEGTVLNVDNSGVISSLDGIHTLLSTFSEPLSWLSSASSTIMGYGIIYVPLIIIVLCLWWFFRQFIR